MLYFAKHGRIEILQIAVVCTLVIAVVLCLTLLCTNKEAQFQAACITGCTTFAGLIVAVIWKIIHSDNNEFQNALATNQQTFQTTTQDALIFHQQTLASNQERFEKVINDNNIASKMIELSLLKDFEFKSKNLEIANLLLYGKVKVTT